MVLKSPQLTISNKLITYNFEYALKSADRPKLTAVYHINRSRQKFSLATSVLGDSYGPTADTHAKWKNKLEQYFQISKHHLISQRENGLDDRFV